jgi:hypothetical protein
VRKERSAVPAEACGRESWARLRLALAAAALLFAYTIVAGRLPRASLRPSLLVAMAVSLPLVSLLCVGLLPLRRFGHLSLIATAAGAALGVLFTALGWPAAANPAKVLAAAGLGFWLAEQITGPSLVVLVAVLAALADVVSVFAGPTKALLAHAPGSLGYFTLAFAWPGRNPAQVFTALGVSDLVFFCLYLCSARRFGLRTAATVVGMAASILVSVVIGLWVSAVPVLPLLGAAFVGVNADLLLRRRREAGVGDQCDDAR